MTDTAAVTECIRRRRTIKPQKYSGDDVPDEIIAEILENANWAPTHGRTEPWRFVVFRGDAKRALSDWLIELYDEQTPPDKVIPAKRKKLQDYALLAPVAITVSMKRQESEKIAEIEEIQAVACAVQNMYLTAAAHGLGAFYSTPKVIYVDRAKEFLELGEKDRWMGIFYVGYPSADWPEGKRRPVEEKVAYRG